MSDVAEPVAPPTALAVETDTDRFHGLFIAFVTVGIILATVLGVREIIRKPIVRLDEVRSSDLGLVPVQAQVLAYNTSEDTTYCTEVTITATDRDGQTLLSLVAVPTSGDGRLAPGRSANFMAVFDGLSEQQIDEELNEFFAFVTSFSAC